MYLGNDEYTARRSYAANVYCISKQLTHCNICLMKLLNMTNVSVDERCSQCLQLNFEDSGHPLLK